MAIGATAAKILKMAAKAAAKSKKGKSVIKTVVGIILGIVILIVGAFFTIADSLSNANTYILSWLFGGDEDNVSFDAGAEYAEELTAYLSEMKVSFANIDTAVTAVNERLTDETLDAAWVKSVYYSIYSENKLDNSAEFINSFTECFITTILVEVETSDEESNETSRIIIDHHNNSNGNMEKMSVKSSEETERKEEKEVLQTNNAELFANIGKLINYCPTEETINTALEFYAEADTLIKG